MDTREREKLIHRIGEQIAAEMPDFYGSVTLNFAGGRYVNSNIVQSIKPEPQKEKGKK